QLYADHGFDFKSINIEEETLYNVIESRGYFGDLSNCEDFKVFYTILKYSLPDKEHFNILRYYVEEKWDLIDYCEEFKIQIPRMYVLFSKWDTESDIDEYFNKLNEEEAIKFRLDCLCYILDSGFLPRVGGLYNYITYLQYIFKSQNFIDYI